MQFNNSAIHELPRSKTELESEIYCSCLFLLNSRPNLNLNILIKFVLMKKTRMEKVLDRKCLILCYPKLPEVTFPVSQFLAWSFHLVFIVENAAVTYTMK